MMPLFWIYVIGLCLTAIGIGLFAEPDRFRDEHPELRITIFWPIYLLTVIGALMQCAVLWLAACLVKLFKRWRKEQ